LQKIESVQQLETWLASKGINTSQWGTGAAKSLQDLWNEITSGDAQVEDEPPRRVLNIVDVNVHSGNKFLLEYEQQLSDGRMRYRGLPLSEKMKPGENPINAAIRGLQEELQVKSSNVKVLNADPQPRPIYRESRSFPGLQTEYRIYEVDVDVEQLPNEDFWTNETQSDHESATKRHHWRWVDKDL
jgi:hypothetical protein